MALVGRLPRSRYQRSELRVVRLCGRERPFDRAPPGPSTTAGASGGRGRHLFGGDEACCHLRHCHALQRCQLILILQGSRTGVARRASDCLIPPECDITVERGWSSDRVWLL
jgi:hypothetical protein